MDIGSDWTTASLKPESDKPTPSRGCEARLTSQKKEGSEGLKKRHIGR